MKRLIPLFALALPLAACDRFEDNCSEEARVSVSVVVLDALGADAADAVVEYDDGRGIEPCHAIEGVYSCAYEVEGDIDISVSAPNYVSQTVTVTVESDECHVITEDLDIELQPEVAE